MITLTSNEIVDIKWRGTVAIVDISNQSDFIYLNEYKNTLPFHIDDMIILDGCIVRILGIECFKNLHGISPKMGILYKVVENA